MGNCVRKGSNKQWADGYWESPVSSPKTSSKLSGGKSRKRAEDSGNRFSSTDGKKLPTTTEVKIKITKKQLEELLGMKEMQGLTLEQVLTRLMIDGGDDVFQSSRRSRWRPSLQSIPE